MSVTQRARVPDLNSAVFVVESDRGVRESIREVLTTRQQVVHTWTCLESFLEDEKPDCPGCLITDLDLYDRSGVEVRRRLESGYTPPIILITERADIPRCVKAMRSGASDVLQKPLAGERLVRAVEEAVEIDRTTRRERMQVVELRRHYEQLTVREREVLPLVASGLLNKQTAARLGISVVTICVHRGQIMRKMAAHSLAELVRMTDKLGLQCHRPREYAPE